MPQLRHRVGELIRHRYEVRKELGSGGFGVVYGCRDAELGIVAAVKELHVLEERETAFAQFRAEAIHLSKLRHRHIVSGHYEKDEGNWNVCPFCGLDFSGQPHCPEHGGNLIAVSSRHYLVMEYIAGPDLLTLLEDFGGVLPIEKIEKYALQLADALAFIHEKGLVHRDIKPENVRLRRAEDEIVLLDFGIATQGEEEGEKYGTRVQRQTTGGGTIGYAPENPDERRRPDARSDVHAFGMTLYHLATGLDPTDPTDLRRMQNHSPQDFRPELSDKLDDLIGDCIRYEAIERPQNGAQILSILKTPEKGVPAWNAKPPSAPAPQPPVPAPVAAPPTVPVSVAKKAQAPRALLFRSGHAVSSVDELAYMVDAAPREFEKLLFSGEIERFLGELGESDLAFHAAQIRSRDARRRKQGVENLGQKLGLARPQIEFSPGEIDFGSLSPEGRAQREIRVENNGRGWLFGLIRASHPAVSTFGEWEGNRERIPVVFNAARLAPGEYGGEIEFNSSAGRVTVPFRAAVSGPSAIPAFASVAICGLLGLFSGAILRVSPRFGSGIEVLDRILGEETARQIGANVAFGGALWCFLGCWAILESIARRSCLLPILFLFFGTALCAFATFVAPEWIRAGDTFLRPLASYAGPRPELSWMVAGAGVGAIYGAIRRFRYWSHGRAWGVVGGFFVVGILINLAVLAARGAL